MEILENLCLQAKDFGIAVNVFWKELPDKFYDPKACLFSQFSLYLGTVMQCSNRDQVPTSLGKGYCTGHVFFFSNISCSVADPCHFGTDPDSVPAIFVSDLPDSNPKIFLLITF
jgi:hypothetical protein